MRQFLQHFFSYSSPLGPFLLLELYCMHGNHMVFSLTLLNLFSYGYHSLSFYASVWIFSIDLSFSPMAWMQKNAVSCLLLSFPDEFFNSDIVLFSSRIPLWLGEFSQCSQKLHYVLVLLWRSPSLTTGFRFFSHHLELGVRADPLGDFSSLFPTNKRRPFILVLQRHLSPCSYPKPWEILMFIVTQLLLVVVG